MLLAGLTGLLMGWRLGPKVGYANYFNVDQSIFIGLAICGALCSIAVPRKRITYVVTTASLAMFTYRALGFVPTIGKRLFPDIQGTVPYILCCAIALVVHLLPLLLLWRYTFGSPSRRYFGY